MPPSANRRLLLARTLSAAATAAGTSHLPFASLAPRIALADDLPSADAPLAADYIGFVLVQRFFPETQHNVDGAMLTYFREHGETEQLGFPLTEQYWEPDSAQGWMVQLFQRARLVFDPASQQVTQAPLGTMMGKHQPAVVPLPGMRYFPDTGHNLDGAFLQWWAENDGEHVLGMPLTEELFEGGHTVQWFEYGRIEWWPESDEGDKVQLALVGAEYLQSASQFVPAEALQPAAALEPLREWILPPPPRRPLRPVAPQRIPILYYHQVYSQDQLRKQIQAFRAAGRNFVTVGQAVAALRGEASLPEKPLALTFDDSWGSQIANVAPVLQAEQITATFFIITRYLGFIPGYMTWDQVRLLKEMGHEVESHTQNHADMPSLFAKDEGAAEAELWESLAILENHLGHSKRIFAYPNGTWNAGVVALVSRVYRGAVATGGGLMQTQDGVYTMRRIKAEPTYSAESLLKQIEA